MDFSDVFDPGEQSRRVQRSILLFVILATLPCYCVGAILLGVAPDEEAVVQSSPPPPEFLTNTATITVTMSQTPNLTPTTTLQNTPGQFFPTNTPVRLPSSAPSLTPQITATITEGPNSAPVFDGALSDANVGVGDTRRIRVAFSDPDGDPVTLTVSSSNTSVATVAMGNNDVYEVTGVSAGQAFITLTLRDNKGATTERTVIANVTSQNQPPVFTTAPSDTRVEVGSATSVAFAFSDPDGDTVAATATAANSSIATASVSGNQIQVVGNSAGSTTVTVELDDGRGGIAQASFTVNVSASNQDPVFTVPPADVAVAAGESQAVSMTASDPDGDTLVVIATSSAPGVASVSGVSASGFTVTGVAAGAAVITINLDDGHGGSAQDTVSVTVTEANQNPIFSVEPEDVVVTSGDSTLKIVQFSDPDGDAVSFTVASNNENIASATKIDGTSFTVQGVAQGTTRIVIRLNDGNGGTAQRTIDVTVSAP